MDDWFENFKKDSKQFEKIKQDAIKRAMRKWEEVNKWLKNLIIY
jgi:hypothetical protein